MSRIVKLASWNGEPRASVVFVHGLGGHVYDTWRRGPDDNTFWPVWLAQDVEGLAVYSLAYEAPPSNWLGTAMPLQDRAVNIFETLLTEPGLRSGPIGFVCHSLGGLIVKKILLDLQQQAARRPEAADFLARVTEVVFAATPHTGSMQASWLDRLRFLAWPSSIARVLVANDPSLRDINVAYRGLADERRSTLRHRIFYETRGTPGGTIVNEASADPGLPGDPPVPIDADHIGIVKPADRSSLLYARVRQFAELFPAAAGGGGDIEVYALAPIRPDQPLNLVPKLIRIVALGLAALIAFKGVQALIAPAADVGAIQKPLVDQLAEKDRQITKLLALLDDKRTTPAPPGADQELRKAVVAIDQGAKVDSRYAEALDLLKAGKPAEAEPLLKAVAEDKVSSAGRESKDAAAAFRNLASIASVSSSARARDYYARAAQLDPSNVEGLCWNGFYQFQAGRLDAAQAAYDLADRTAGPSDANWDFWAKTGLGDILVERGDLSAAFKRYSEGLAVADRLVQSDPGNAVWKRDLSVAFEKIGDVQLSQGDLPAALKSYTDSLANRDDLAKSDPGNAEWQRDLSASLDKIGNVRIRQGDLSGALRNYTDSRAISERLAKSDPGNAEWQRDLSVSIANLGDVQQAQGDLPAALTSYRSDLVIADRLTKSDPGNAEWQHDLAVFFNKIGDVQIAQGDLPGALKSYTDGLAISERLAKSDPGNARWQHDLSQFFELIGDVRLAQGDASGALVSYMDDFTIRDRLAKSDSSNADWQRDLSVSFNKIGDVQAARGDPAAALKSYRDGLAVAQRLATSDSTNSGRQRDLSVSYSRIGNVQIAKGDLPGALRSYSDSLAIAERLAASEPGNAGWQRDLSVSFDKIGDVQLAQGDLAGALGSYGDGLAIRERLAKSDPGNASRQHDLSTSFGNLAAVLRNQNDKAKALDHLAQGRDIMLRLTRLAPENATWKQELNRFEMQIGELSRAGRG
jgi:tetratricopeptide (TPR) repeat protein